MTRSFDAASSSAELKAARDAATSSAELKAARDATNPGVAHLARTTRTDPGAGLRALLPRGAYKYFMAVPNCAELLLRAYKYFLAVPCCTGLLLSAYKYFLAVPCAVGLLRGRYFCFTTFLSMVGAEVATTRAWTFVVVPDVMTGVAKQRFLVDVDEEAHETRMRQLLVCATPSSLRRSDREHSA